MSESARREEERQRDRQNRELFVNAQSLERVVSAVQRDIRRREGERQRDRTENCLLTRSHLCGSYQPYRKTHEGGRERDRETEQRTVNAQPLERVISAVQRDTRRRDPSLLRAEREQRTVC